MEGDRSHCPFTHLQAQIYDKVAEVSGKSAQEQQALLSKMG